MLCVVAVAADSPGLLLFKEKPRSCSWYYRRHHEKPCPINIHRLRCNSLPMRKKCQSSPAPMIQHNDLWLQWYRRHREHGVGHSLSWPELCNTVVETHHDVRIPLDAIEADDLSWSLEEEEDNMLDVLSALSDSSLPPLKMLPLSANLVTMQPAEIPIIEEEEKEKVPRRLLHGMKRAFKRRSPRRGLKALHRSVSEHVLNFSGNSPQQRHRIYSQTPRGQSSANGMKLPT